MSGHQIPFHSVPVTKCSDLTVPLVDAEANKLLPIGVIKAIAFSKESLYSRLFLVPKKEGTYRPVIDLSWLNSFVDNCLFFSNGEHFLSEDTVKKGRLHAMHRPKGYISFCQRTQVLTKGPVLTMEKQSFGLNTAPRVFTKLIKPIAAYLRKRSIRIIVYLDDFLILGSSIKESKANTQLPLDPLPWLGFSIIREKSMLVPTQSLTSLGLSIDWQSMSLSLPEKKIMIIQSKCQSLVPNPTSSAREIANLIGSLEAARPAIWQAPLHYRELQIQLIKSLSRQLQDTHIPKQRCSHWTSVVAPEHNNRKRQYHQFSCPRAVHNLRSLLART